MELTYANKKTQFKEKSTKESTFFVRILQRARHGDTSNIERRICGTRNIYAH